MLLFLKDVTVDGLNAYKEGNILCILPKLFYSAN